MKSFSVAVFSFFSVVSCGFAFAQNATVAPAVDAILESAGDAGFLVVGDGPLCDALASRARQTHPQLVIFPLRAVQGDFAESLREAVAAVAPSVRVRDAAELGPVPFMAAWLEEDPDGAMRAFALADAPGAPSIVQEFDSMPQGAVWRIVRREARHPGAEQISAFESVRDDVGEFLSLSPISASEASDPLETALRRHFSRLANDLGCALALDGDMRNAREMFVAAHSILPGAPSAILNLASLEKMRKEPDGAARARLAGLLQKLKPSGGMLALDGGVLLRPQDFFDAGWYWTLSGLSVSDTNALAAAMEALPLDAPRESLAGLVRASFSLQRGNAEGETSFYGKNVGAEGLTPKLRLQAAETIMATTGDSVRALALLERFSVPAGGETERMRTGGEIPFWFEALAFCARTLAAKGDNSRLAVLRAKVLLRLVDLPEVASRVRREVFAPASVDLCLWKDAESDFSSLPDAPFSILCAAAGALARGDAKAALLALGAEPPVEKNSADVRWAWHRMLLEASFRAGDRDAAADAARRILALRPRDPFALWILGNLAQQRGDKNAALKLLQLSVAVRPAWFALNDLSVILAESGNAVQAERFARMAIENAGEKIPPALFDTLGEAIYAQGRYKEAAARFRDAAESAKAAAMPDARINLHLAEALEKAGDPIGASAQIKIVDEAKDGLSIAERERLGAVRKAVEKALEATLDND